MVYFYSSCSQEGGRAYEIITGRDKFENDLLIKWGYRELNYIWFHADKYSSGHIYLKLFPDEKSLDDVPTDVVSDCLQLCKSESIQGNKMSQCTIICTPWHNLRKSKDMKPGEVSFKSLNKCKRIECYARNQKSLNRLSKTRIEVTNDVEELLNKAKKSKDADFLSNYVSQNREKLLEEEKERKRAKKESKRQKILEQQEEEC